MKKQITEGNRFEVSTEGMKGLHAGRPLWGLVKELVANVWDEPTATICSVVIEPVVDFHGERPECIKVSVGDDGDGFADATDAYTLMAPTNKRNDASVRGRFNIGEKEIISIAEHAEVKTVGTTVEFPKEGGRVVTKNRRKSGTIVTAIVERPHSEIAETINRLREFMPPLNKVYRVHGETVVRPEQIATVMAKDLPTIIASGIGEPLRPTGRNCDIDIHHPASDGKGRIYEMGILIQEIDAPYSIDIQQKVPMPPNRDTVTSGYLQDVYAHVLNAVADNLQQSEASEAWVQMAIEDQRTEDQTVSKVMTAKLGESAVLWSSDTQANESAHAAGMDLIAPRTLSKIERERFKKAGLVSAKEGFGRKTSDDPDFNFKFEVIRPTEAMKNVRDYTKWLSNHLLGFECDVRFVKMHQKGTHKVAAQYGERILDFVVDTLGKKWFNMDERPTKEQTEIILHELAHEGGSKTPHTGEYVDNIAKLGAMATHLALEIPWWKKETKGA
jgi:hypothetical protein